MWYHNGVLHRDNGPAIEEIDGSNTWYRHGLPHREDGPAFSSFYTKHWYQHGVLHRLDGPAIQSIYWGDIWFFEGRQVKKEQLEKFAARIHLREARTRAFILDRMLPIIYNPRRKSGQRRMLEPSCPASPHPLGPLSI